MLAVLICVVDTDWPGYDDNENHSVIAGSALQRAFAAATSNLQSISALKSIHI